MKKEYYYKLNHSIRMLFLATFAMSSIKYSNAFTTSSSSGLFFGSQSECSFKTKTTTVGFGSRGNGMSLGRLYAMKDDSNGSSKKLFEKLRQRSCMKQFLTQRCIQSFVYLLSECHDGKTAEWMEEFVESKGLLHFHGTGKFNMTKFPEWDSILLALMDELPTTVNVTMKQPQGGSSSNRGVYNQLTGKRNKVNPYIKKEVSTKPTIFYCFGKMNNETILNIFLCFSSYL